MQPVSTDLSFILKNYHFGSELYMLNNWLFFLQDLYLCLQSGPSAINNVVGAMIQTREFLRLVISSLLRLIPASLLPACICTCMLAVNHVQVLYISSLNFLSFLFPEWYMWINLTILWRIQYIVKILDLFSKSFLRRKQNAHIG